jgi:hypothetical protein
VTLAVVPVSSLAGLADRQRRPQQHPHHGRVAAPEAGITERFQAAGHLADPAQPGQRDQVADPVGGS